MDSSTHAPLPNVSISIKNSPRGSLTNAEGRFRITADPGVKKITCTTAGYAPFSITITDSTVYPVTVLLSKSYTLLQGVTVNGRPGRYRNKNNPAVELIRKVIANKAKNGPGHEPYTSYRQYEKVRVLADKLPRLLIDNKLLKKYHFIFENRDTVLEPGKSLIPIYLEEVLSDLHHRKQPESTKKVILGRKSVDFGEYIDMKGISGAMNRLYEDFNVYDNTSQLFTMQFISPISDLAPTFYMYFIRDTIVEEGEKLVHLYFTPRNPEDLLFRGNLYITLDGNYAVKRLDLTVSKHINLNYVRDFDISQDFEKGPGEGYYLANSDVIARFSPFPKSAGMVAQRKVTITGVTDTILPDIVFRGRAVDTLTVASRQVEDFWDQERPAPLSIPEQKTYTNTDSLVNMRSYRRIMDYATAFTAGYKSAGKVDIGPIGNFYTFNPIEGQRLRFGGRSNTKWSTRYFGESYIAYGFRDERWKYFVSASYALNNKSIYTFPFHYVQVSFLHDTRNLGQENVFAQGNNFFSSFSRGDNSKWLYNDLLRISYVHEYDNHFSYNLGFKYWQQQPTGSLTYRYEPAPDQFDTVPKLTTTELSATLRWAPHELFFQNKAGRSDIVNKYPIMTFQYAHGIGGLLNGAYNYNAFHLNIYQRWYLAPFGYSDVTLDAGFLGGNLPFPLLIIHPANQSYFYSENAYNLMNIGEFVSDHYAGINIDHFFNGFFFNKIPGLKRLRLREVIAAKVLFGGLRDENNPAVNPSQMKFPLTNGLTSTYALGRQPYVEASVGINNIFTIWRLDLVKRFTYLDHPGIPIWGLRISSNFNF
jgi:Family of unknown function (DUF5686)/CarboxypepD_reg-like domain